MPPYQKMHQFRFSNDKTFCDTPIHNQIIDICIHIGVKNMIKTLLKIYQSFQSIKI